MAMFQGISTRIFGNSGKTVATNIVIIGNAFVWYSFAFSFLTTAISGAGLSDNFLFIMGIHFLGVLSSLVFGELVSRKIKRRILFLLYWMVAGVILSLIPLVTSVSTYTGVLILAVITGVTFGFGIPTCLGYFAASTEAANRGRLGGITFLLIGAGAYSLSLMGNENVALVILVLATWKIVGAISLFALKPEEKHVEQKHTISYSLVLSNKTFLLYFIPWAMFLLMNSLTFPINEEYFTTELVRMGSSIEFVLGGVSAVVFGFLADSIGRKRLAVAGFALLGLGYAILGFSLGNILGWWFYTFVDGVAWGIFITIFLFTLWGDLAEERRSEKYYAIGILPYLLSTFLRFSLGTFIANAINNYSLIFSFVSFFLFLAVLPLVYAPETLPDKIMKERELKNYVEKAQKEATKALKKEVENTPRENGDDYVKFEGEDFEEVLKEAEKYY